jgi:hypothetical protein
MRVHRFAFGVLGMGVSALVVSACEVYVVRTQPPAASVYRAPPPPPPPAPAPVRVVRAAPPPPLPRPVRVRRVGIAASSRPTTPAAEDSETTTAPSLCLDPGAATVGDCDGAKVADATCTPSPHLAQKCAAFKTYLDPKVAAAAVACVSALTAAQACDVAGPAECLRGALERACPDSALVQLCQVAATSCKITATECTAMLSGLNDQGQQDVAQCVSQGCAAGLYACVSALGSAPTSSAFH